MFATSSSRRRARDGVRALLAAVGMVGVLVAVVAAVAYGGETLPAPQEVDTVALAPAAEHEQPVVERNLAVFAEGEAERAEAQAAEDAALAYAAQLAAEQEAAAQQAAAEQAAAEAAAAEAAAQREREAAAYEFAATLAEQEQEAPPAPTQPPPPPAVHGDPFDALAQCESGRNPNAFNPAGPYYGAFQFHPGTWSAYAPDMPGLPTAYTYAQQKTVAQRLQAARGWSPWPHCARQLGLL